ncbi:zinc-binding alcohol dehydrogenase family protein [Aliidiomarina iranensis]|uniref:Zinc-type alcohol dehydrogenase-like protein n=1 Tax=Aliidiomarina iranensis TaxID=1434071 RepID=A0A432W0K9_9GAMM|nr:zinc-binding alcohol dehydrogenase family protein [Aliidiomarina iranensis]RUO22559.1 zinc-binding alcohol dehydrogenase family protein [Aliidiomarina iranensis]
MKAIGHQYNLPSHDTSALEDIEVQKPVVAGRDLLVKVEAISVNPVDCKIRSNRAPEKGEWQILGWDAAGIVEAVGPEVSQFKPGDRVWYAGDITRQGSNAEYQCVDERITGHMPTSLNFAEAAALPLTAITAWEILFDSFRLPEHSGEQETLLVIGGAGGVGSILIQLAKKLTKLNVIATASRPETVDWVKQMGADDVINHRESLPEQLQKLNLQPRYVAALTGTQEHFAGILELIKPRGHVAVIDDPETLDIKAGKQKALTFSWEFMFTRSMFETDDMQQQQVLLNRVAAMIDAGAICSTKTKHLGTINAENLRAAHAEQEAGTVIGKNVLSGF